jgi:nucleotide-binding universal stress UspA family protein
MRSYSSNRRRRPRQEEARLDLDEHRRHQQVLGRELELRAPHHLDVAQVLARELRHRDVEHVHVLLADQVEQQVERSLEGLEEHLERLGRDVEVDRQRRERLAVDARDRLRRRRRVLEVEQGFGGHQV